MQRRNLMAACGIAMLAVPRELFAQRLYRVGFLFPGPAPTDKLPQVQSVLRGLAKLGYVQGRNLVIEGRGAEAP